MFYMLSPQTHRCANAIMQSMATFEEGHPRRGPAEGEELQQKSFAVVEELEEHADDLIEGLRVAKETDLERSQRMEALERCLKTAEEMQANFYRGNIPLLGERLETLAEKIRANMRKHSH